MYRIALLIDGRMVDTREFSDYRHYCQSFAMYAAQGYGVRGQFPLVEVVS